MVNPADVPTKSSENARKSGNAVDSGSWRGVYGANSEKAFTRLTAYRWRCVHDKIEELDHQRHDPSERNGSSLNFGIWASGIPAGVPRAFLQLKSETLFRLVERG